VDAPGRNNSHAEVRDSSHFERMRRSTPRRGHSSKAGKAGANSHFQDRQQKILIMRDMWVWRAHASSIPSSIHIRLANVLYCKALTMRAGNLHPLCSDECYATLPMASRRPFISRNVRTCLYRHSIRTYSLKL